MSDINPYEPPSAEAEAPRRKKARKSKSRRYHRDGDLVVVERVEGRLPKRCVVCNRPIVGDRLRKQFSWHPQWVYATIAIGFLIYIIAAAVTRKGATVHFGLCAEHTKRRETGVIVTWIGAAVAAVLFIGGLTASAPGVALLGLCAGLVVLFVGAFMARTAYPTKMDDGYCWLKVGQPFLESIAESDDD